MIKKIILGKEFPFFLLPSLLPSVLAKRLAYKICLMKYQSLSMVLPNWSLFSLRSWDIIEHTMVLSELLNNKI